ncbi:hypothetical protein [Neptunomonas sp.]|uniref:hypothetical protein n=1 Tax=Neptunomonas TaxID=75687 RepID=UPI003511D72F
MNIEKEKERLSQQKMLDSILHEPKPTEMLTVYFSDYGSGDHNYGIYCALVPIDQKEEALSSYTWDLSIGSGMPGSSVYYDEGVETPEYHRFGSDNGIEPLVICRDFYGFKDDYKEVCEEFRLFHNLYHDHINNRYIKIDDDGNEATIIEVKSNHIQIRSKELKQFLAIKEMFLSIQFDCREHSLLSEDELSLDGKELSEESEFHIWTLAYGDFGGISEHQAFSRMLGKKLIKPFPKSKSGLYGFTKEEPKKYVDFIIDADEVGDDVSYSSNPDLLANFFGANPEAPNYLTPVHFKKEVLDKYYGKPSKYAVSDSSLSCASLWGLQIDNHHDGKVCVWLGDLGRDLPYEEQLHWRSYNIAPSGGISETYYKRQVMAQFTDSDRLEHIFKSKYSELQQVSTEKLGWNLLLPLNDEDIHHFECLRIPSTNEQRDFDDLVLGLTKVLIDSLNEKQLNKFIEKELRGDIKGGISRLEAVFKNNCIEEYEDHIHFLRKLQNLRSSSSAHRKGSNYKKIATEFEIGSKDLISVFGGILAKSVDLLDYFIGVCSSEELQKS